MKIRAVTQGLMFERTSSTDEDPNRKISLSNSVERVELRVWKTEWTMGDHHCFTTGGV